MSHFCGLVVLTPKYLENHNLEDSLEKYNENLEVPEYSKGEVSDYEKVEFIMYYLKEDNVELIDLKEKLYSKLLEEGRIEPYSEEKDGERYRFMFRVVYDNKERYVELFKETYPEYFSKFDEMYEEHGDDWNGGDWRINPISGKWEEYSTYNPNAVYETGEEAFKQTLSNAYDTFGSEIFNQLYHTDMENFNFDNKIIDQAIVQVYERYQDNNLPQYADILDEIENLIFDMSREKLGR